MKKTALFALLTVLTFPIWGQNAPLSLYLKAGGQYYAFPTDPVDKSYPGGRLGLGVDIPFQGRPAYLSVGIESGLNRLSVSPSDETLFHVPFTAALMFHNPFQKFLKGRFTLGAGLVTGAALVIAAEGGASFLIGPRLETALRLWDGKAPGSLYLGLGADIIPQRRPVVIIMPAVELGLRLRFPPGAAAKPAKAPEEDAQAEETADSANEETTDIKE